jgi:phosphopantothenoylcysteine decarboxylase/phosphopantothenate--cysteine ligase
MRCIVTAGPTYEPLDHVRRLTNMSSGRLGSELVNHLTAKGHEVTLLIGHQATWQGERNAVSVKTFTTTEHLRQMLEGLAETGAEAVFHAAAVSDFSFGKVFRRAADGELSEIRSGKISTREGGLLVELVPTPKIIRHLRSWYPNALLVGWKYEVEGTRDSVLRLASHQIDECRTDACVANGPAYGTGFGLLQRGKECCDLPDSSALFNELDQLLRTARPGT